MLFFSSEIDEAQFQALPLHEQRRVRELFDAMEAIEASENAIVGAWMASKRFHRSKARLLRLFSLWTAGNNHWSVLVNQKHFPEPPIPKDFRPDGSEWILFACPEAKRGSIWHRMIRRQSGRVVSLCGGAILRPADYWQLRGSTVYLTGEEVYCETCRNSKRGAPSSVP